MIRVARETQPHFEYAVPTELPSSRLALRLVDRFVLDAATRQRVLEAGRGIDRVALATEALRSSGPPEKPCARWVGVEEESAARLA